MMIKKTLLTAVLAVSALISAYASGREPAGAPVSSAAGALVLPRGALTPLQVTAADIITKVYGVLDTRLDTEGLVEASRETLAMSPSVEDSGVWLDSSSGYRLCYQGMTPDVSAVAVYDGDVISSYGYFFLFPYDMTGRGDARDNQARFCSALLQELADMGLDPGADVMTDALFEVVADYEGHQVDLRLVEEPAKGQEHGRFMLVVNVEPVNPADLMTAEL